MVIARWFCVCLRWLPGHCYVAAVVFRWMLGCCYVYVRVF